METDGWIVERAGRSIREWSGKLTGPTVYEPLKDFAVVKEQPTRHERAGIGTKETFD